MGESVPRVPKLKFAGPSGTDMKMSHLRDKSPEG